MARSPGNLERTLGLSDAVVIGLGSMIGAGVYAVWPAASRSSGQLLLLGLAIAALVAFLNAIASARLAVVHPQSGGTYVYGREQLGAPWGFIAGWGFVVGKTASCAAMASTIGAYVLPEQSRAVATASIVGITLINIGGLQRTVVVTRILLSVTTIVLVLAISSGLGSGFDPSSILPWSGTGDHRSTSQAIYDTVQSAGLLFFAFAGYARIATLGEEVREPERTIPRAIVIALTGVLILYGLIAVTLLGSFDLSVLSSTVDPLRLLVEEGRFSNLAPVVRAGATIAALGALLNLLPGVSRTALAMARNSDLPTFFAHIDARRSLPVRAEITIALVAIAIVMLFDVRSSIALSGVGVLSYYAITNASALTLPSRRKQRLAASLGLVGCLTLIVCLPVDVLVPGCAVLASGFVAWSIRRRFKTIAV